MDDPELEAIRQRRLAELQAGNPQFGGQNSAEAQQQKEQQRQEQEERRQMMLQQILTGQARERLSRIKLVKPDKARGVEDLLIRAAQTGQIGEKVDENRLISLLEQLSEKEKKTTITIKRRSALDDD